MEQELMLEPQEPSLEFKDIMTVGMILVVTVIAISYGASVISDVRADFTSDSLEDNVTKDGLSGIGNLSGKIPTIATLVGVAIILGVLFRNFIVR